MIEIQITQAQNVSVTDELIVTLSDGRTISVPLAWYPRLWHGTPAERNNWRLIGKGDGIHWEASLMKTLALRVYCLVARPVKANDLFAEWLGERAPHVK